MAAITSALIGAGVAIGTSVANGLSRRSSERRADNRSKMAAIKGVENINKLLGKNQISFSNWLHRYRLLMDSQKGETKRIMADALKNGMVNINDQLTLTQEKIQFNIDEAKKVADKDERKLLERVDERFKELRKENREAQRQVKNSFTQQGINGGALSAALTRLDQNLGEVTKDLEKMSNDNIADIKDRFAQVQRSGIFEMGQAGTRANIETRNLSQSLAREEAERLQNLELTGFQMEDNRRNQFEAKRDDLLSAGMDFEAQHIAAGGSGTGRLNI